MVTGYDAWSARLIAHSHVDAVLVGDSAAMVMHGHPTTIAATVRLMAAHTGAVARGIGEKFLIGRSAIPVVSQGHPRCDDGSECADDERGTGREARRRGRPRGGHPEHRGFRRAGHGARRTHAAVSQPARRVPSPGTERCRCGASASTGSCPRGSRLLLDRARVRSGTTCGADSRQSCSSLRSASGPVRAPTGRSLCSRTSGGWTRVTPRDSCAGISTVSAC